MVFGDIIIFFLIDHDDFLVLIKKTYPIEETKVGLLVLFL